MKNNIKVTVIEPYVTELKRKEFRNTSYRIFKHPNLYSAYIVAKNGNIIGTCSFPIIRRTFRSGVSSLSDFELDNFDSSLNEFSF